MKMLNKVKDFIAANEKEISNAVIIISAIVMAAELGYIYGALSVPPSIPNRLHVESIGDGRLLIDGRLFEKIIK